MDIDLKDFSAYMRKAVAVLIEIYEMGEGELNAKITNDKGYRQWKVVGSPVFRGEKKKEIEED